jgi:hypothetical protein
MTRVIGGANAAGMRATRGANAADLIGSQAILWLFAMRSSSSEREDDVFPKSIIETPPPGEGICASRTGRGKHEHDRPYADPEKAARKILEIANSVEAVQDGRIHIEKINGPFLFREKGTPVAGRIQGDRARLARAARERDLCEVHAGGCRPVCLRLPATPAPTIYSLMRTAFDPCIPTRGTKVPDRPEWIHEIKHDGYRLIVQRDGQRVRLFTRNGHDWSDRFPPIAEAALRNRNTNFVIDGEAVLLGVDGRSLDSVNLCKRPTKSITTGVSARNRASL